MEQQLFVKMIMDRWNASLDNADKLLQSLSDQQLEKEIAPGKNRGIYLLGHLIAVHDDMLRLLDMGNPMHPELKEPFLTNADKVSESLPSIPTLRQYWSTQLEMLQIKFSNVSAEQWFEKHTAVTADDFAKEPHRNKLNIILTRTTHLQYHIGQMILLK